MYVVSLYDNPYEHSSMDTMDKIDFSQLEQVARGGLAVVLEMAGSAPE